jgi:hypothetical protein
MNIWTSFPSLKIGPNGINFVHGNEIFGPRKSRAKRLLASDGVSFMQYLFLAQQNLVGQGVLMIEASRSHSDTPHSMELLWTSD